MKSATCIAVAFAGAMLSPACKPGTNQPENTDPATIDDSRPELFLYAVTVENLRLRDKPGQSGQVLVQLREGELVEGPGNASDNIEEIELRGVSHRAPYLEITADGENKPTGWAFGGGLRCVYAGPRAGSPDREKLGAFSNFLLPLDPKDIQSSGKAWAFVEQHYAGATGPLADAVFLLFEHFLRRMQTEGEFYKITEALSFSETEMQAIGKGMFDAEKHPQTAALAANGFRLLESEGSVFPAPDWRKLQDFFGPIVTPTMQKFVNQRTMEQKYPIFDDGGVLVPLENVADLAVFWEKFNRTDPYFPLSEETRESERWLRILLVTGADNSPVFDAEDQSIVPAYKTMWEYVQDKHPKTTLGKQIREMAEICTAEGWKRTQKVADFQAKLQDAQ